MSRQIRRARDVLSERSHSMAASHTLTLPTMANPGVVWDCTQFISEGALNVKAPSRRDGSMVTLSCTQVPPIAFPDVLGNLRGAQLPASRLD